MKYLLLYTLRICFLLDICFFNSAVNKHCRINTQNVGLKKPILQYITLL